ncbi:hypothetical protein RND71_000155 [Anisodus tanguticus]|uniref:PCI domain-containing protein n=1 Tax=Anisodus tanguticus TaxID=243964 RepID=A0AAE1VPR6_9SOLA|nr:hypothetical protein RND71_000155 [Anisodus tanguticus]
MKFSLVSVVEDKLVFFKTNRDIKIGDQSATSVYDCSVDPSVLQDLKEIASLIESGAYTSEVRKIYKVMRFTMKLRRKLKASILSAFLKYALSPGSEVNARLSSYLPQDRHDNQVDVEMSETEVHSKRLVPELEIYCYLLVLIFLIDQKKYNEAKTCSSESIVRLKNMNSRTSDKFEGNNLLAFYRSATVRHNNLSQETLVNLLLRNYLHYNLYDRAEKNCSKAHQAEALTNGCLFYQGKIKTIQLEYTDAKDSFLQAAKKGPLTVAIRVGDLELFRTVAEKFSSAFSQDKTSNLVVRLGHNVIRTGLRNISASCSRISLADIAKKLNLDFENPVDDAENIVAKAIRDGAIYATLDHDNGWLVSKANGDVYSTNEPQIAFDSRIAFCLNMHNEALRALRFPQNLRNKESVAR